MVTVDLRCTETPDFSCNKPEDWSRREDDGFLWSVGWSSVAGTLFIEEEARDSAGVAVGREAER